MSMPISRLRCVTLFVLAMVAMLAVSARADESSGKVDALFSALIGRGDPGAAVGIYRQGKVVYTRGYGLANLEHDVPVTPRTVFHIASVSKQFTAFSAALLAREGKLDLRADVRKYLPYVPRFDAPMLVNDLIWHTSGLRDQWYLFNLAGRDDRDVLKQQHILNMVARQRGLDFSPGSDWSYSNTGYTLLAEVVQAAAGQPFTTFARERIFEPLGMSHTQFYRDISQIVPGRAESYRAVDDSDRERGGARWERAVLSYETVGATSMLTTVEDLLKWANNFGHPRVGDAALIEQIGTPGKLRNDRPLHYAFGINRSTLGGRDVLTHTGSDAGFAAVFSYFPREDFAVAILANRPLGRVELTQSIAEIYLGTPNGTPPADASATNVRAPMPAELQAAGSYFNDRSRLVTLTARNGALFWQEGGGRQSPVEFRADGSFYRQPRTTTLFRLARAANGSFAAFEEIPEPDDIHPPVRFERVARAAPSAAQLASYAGDYRSSELDITYTFSSERGRLEARSLWLAEPISFAPSIADRFDSDVHEMSTVTFVRDAGQKIVAVRIDGPRARNILLERVSAMPAGARSGSQ